ncbi:IcmF-related protein [Cereibacter sphaeroides]|uniref:ImcF-related family protein n=1 Tax=Cereibacter sphaeroides TaxID=1063 RepID=UPI001F391614|nr:ImcF-related family protein [Cereibacter sphaeroides]MCE6950775.1 IcmF-related protein [Cereibacter sphaeroides]
MPGDLWRSDADADALERAAAPVLAFAAALDRARGERAPALAERAGQMLGRFAAEAARLGARAAAVPPARLALALLVDQRARENRRLDIGEWSAAAQRHLFDGRAVSVQTVQDFARRAAEAGPEFDAARRFLERRLAELESGRTAVRPPATASWTGMVVVLIAAFGLAVGGWALHVERTFHRQLWQTFEHQAAALAAQPLGRRLDGLAEAAAAVAVQADRAPLHLGAALLGFDAAQRAEAAYRRAVQKDLPPALARAIDTAIASEAGPAESYDTLRAWAMLSGAAGFSPAWLAGWAERRAGADVSLAGLARHAIVLLPPADDLPAPDAELLAQARGFAATAPEDERAWLELERSEGAAALPPWRADRAVPGLAAVVLRRSGTPLAAPMPGLFTPAGWNHARDRGAGLAVQRARDEAARLFGPDLPRQNDAADRVLDLLQRETLARWSDFLADLRVVPFRNPETAVLVSGTLARPGSPLTLLLREVWRQAGGEDRTRPHPLQLQIAATFGPMQRYVEQGGMAQIGALFAGLNVALGSLDRDSDTGLQRLMRAEERARSITTLRQAPPVVTGIVEDLLAQAGAAQGSELTNPLTRAWQAEALPACRAAVEGRYPFAAEGADADTGAVAAFLGPGGALERFLGRAAPSLDRTASPWRWKTEARFSGLSPETAAFLERAAALAGALPAEAPFTLTALAEKGSATFALGGQGGPVTTASDSLRLRWPGPEPVRGAGIALRAAEGEARLAEAGPWGLLRLLEPYRLRERDGGRRFLIDLRAGGARVFLEAAFDSSANPLAARRLARGLSCPQVL